MTPPTLTCRSCWCELDTSTYPLHGVGADTARAHWLARAQDECYRWLAARERAAIALHAAREGRSIAPAHVLGAALAEQGTLIPHAERIADALYGHPFAHRRPEQAASPAVITPPPQPGWAHAAPSLAPAEALTP